MLTIKLPFREPVTETHKRYLYFKNNRLHIMIPIVGGIDISTDNTCRTVSALKTCLQIGEHSVMSVLLRYKQALEYDLCLMQDLPDNVVRQQKQDRHSQIIKYLDVLNFVRHQPCMYKLNQGYPDYPLPIQRIINLKSNLYGMILCPTIQDNVIRVKEPVFSVQRGKEGDTQLFYHALQIGYHQVAIQSKAPKDLLKRAALAQYQNEEKQDEKKSADEVVDDHGFQKIQNILTSLVPSNAKINFMRPLSGKGMSEDKNLTAQDIKNFLNVDTPTEYIDALVELCVSESDLVEEKAAEKPRSPFDLPDKITDFDRREKLSILTQFFLAQVNFYCYANQLSSANFGKVLDEAKGPELSMGIAATIKTALESGASVENAFFDFINKNREAFSITRELGEAERLKIQKQFASRYATLEEAKHFDDGMVFDPEKNGSFLTHQGFICVDFADILAEAEFRPVDSPEFEEIRKLSRQIPRIVEPVPPDSNRDDVTIEDAALKAYVAKLGEARLKEMIVHAVKNSNIHFLRFCKEANIDLRFKDKEGNNLIHIAAQQQTDPANVINFLRDVCGIDPLEKNKQDITVIHWLVAYGHQNMLTKRALLGSEEKNIPLDEKDLSAPDKRGLMPIHYAVWRQKADMVALLPVASMNDLTRSGRSVAHYAASYGHLNMLQALKAHGVNLNLLTTSIMDQYRTPFDFVMRGYHWKAAFFLMTSSFQNSPDEDKATFDTRRIAQWRMFKKLTQEYVELKDHSPNSLRQEIFKRLGDEFKQSDFLKMEQLKDLIETGIERKGFKNIHIKMLLLRYPLKDIIPHLSEKSQLSILENISKNKLKKNIENLSDLNKLLKGLHLQEHKKFLLDKIGKADMFALLAAAAKSRDKINLAIFFSHGVIDLSLYKEKDKQDFIDSAMLSGSVLKILCRHGLDIFAKDKHGRMLAHHAAIRGKADAISIIKTKLDVPDEWGQSPVHYAVKNASLDVIRMLPKGILNQKNSAGETAVEIAVQQALDEMYHNYLFIFNMKILDVLKYCEANVNLSDEKGLNFLKKAYQKAASFDLSSGFETPEAASRWDLAKFLLMALEDKKTQWEQFEKIISYVSTPQFFLNRLGSLNLQTILQSGIETKGVDAIKATILACKGHEGAALLTQGLATLEERQEVIRQQNRYVIWHDEKDDQPGETKATANNESRRTPRA
jgi:ankyrin repeat protein